MGHFVGLSVVEHQPVGQKKIATFDTSGEPSSLHRRMTKLAQVND